MSGGVEVVQVSKSEYEALKKRVEELERELAFREERESQEGGVQDPQERGCGVCG